MFDLDQVKGSNTGACKIIDFQRNRELRGVLQGVYSINDANVLVMSLRATSTEVAKEILDAWYSESVREEEKPTIEHLKEIESYHFGK